MDQENNKKENCPLCEVPKESIEILKKERPSDSQSKKEYDKRKREKEKEYAKQYNMKKNKKTAAILLSIMLIAGGLSFILIKQFSGAEAKPAGTPIMEVNPKEYDAGSVSMAAGVIKYTYEIQNKGDGDLKISNIKTSCHCTTARLKVGGKESPEFGMDNVFSSWSQKIPGGEKGYLEVTFDPAYHGASGVGEAVRAVYFSTNDPQNKNSEVRLLASVIP